MAEVALALVALIGAGLFVGSLRSAQEVQPGFESERLLLMRVNMGNAGYSPEEGEQFYEELLARLSTLPGVESASVSSGRVLGGGLLHTTYPEGVDIADGLGIHVQDIVVTPSYFETLGIPLVVGRSLNDFDRSGSTRVAVVNEATRRLFWPGQDPVGRRFTRSADDFHIEVAGVVGDVQTDLSEPAQPIIYTVLRQFYQSAVQVQVRTIGDPSAIVLPVQSTIGEIDPALPLLEIATIKDNIHQALWAPRMGSALLSAFGALALLLAVVGIYGVMSYSVSQRRHELGLRLALGAGQGRVIRLVLRQGMTLVMIGVAFGLVLAFGTTRLLRSMLWDVSATDVSTFAAVTGMLVLVAALATLIPALRVTRVDPLIAIRDGP